MDGEVERMGNVVRIYYIKIIKKIFTVWGDGSAGKALFI